MQRGKDGKFHKNGWFRTYFGDGKLEREGTYRDDVRVGVWHIYNQDGSIAQTVDFGEGRRRLPVGARTAPPPPEPDEPASGDSPAKEPPPAKEASP